MWLEFMHSHNPSSLIEASRVREQEAVRKKGPSANEKDPTATAIIPYGKTKSPLGRNRMLV